MPRGLFRMALPQSPVKAVGARDLGPTSGSAATGKLRLLFGRTPDQEAALAELLASQKDPRSPQYRRWLTPEQYGARFGASDEQIRAASAWLAGQGFRVEAAPAGRTFLAFSGTVGQLNRAFGAAVHSFSVGATEHHAATQEPKVPSALKGLVRAVSPLSDLPAANRSGVHAASAGRLSAMPGQPKRFLSDPGNGQFYFTPAEAATVYNAPNSFNRNAPAGVQRLGSGVNIGIVGYSDLPIQDYLNYRKIFLNEASPTAPNQIIDGIDPGVLAQHDGQVTLVAAELAAALAPKATISVYSSQSDLMEDGLVNAIIRAVEDNQVSILSLSYSTCEYYLGAGGNYQVDELWKQAAAQGISVVVGTGDSGSGGCDAGASAQNGLAVNGFASTPWNLAVGGTDFDYSGTDFAQFLSPGASATSPVAAALAGYVPESPWNDSIANNPAGPFAANTAAEYDYGSGPSTLVAGGGGGLSNQAFCPDPAYPGYGDCSVGLTGYAAPAFQSAAGQTARAVPDVALFAGTHRQYQATWAVCSDNQIAQANYTFVNCQPGADGSFSIEGAGGTETAGPAFAGILALVSESLGGQRLGLVDNVLYRMANDPTLKVFHDVTAGNNSVPCVSGSLDCGAGGFLNGYDAGSGYDFATGLGSVDVSALIAAWPNVAFTPTTTTLTANGATSLTITHGAGVTLGATVTPADAVGTVSVTSAANQAGASVNEGIALAGGTGSTFTRRLPGGNYAIHGRYSGDVSHGPSVSSDVQLTVAKEDSTLRLSNEIQNLHDRSTMANVASISYGTYGFLYVQPVGAASDADGPATGTVNLLNGGTAFSTADAPSAQTLNSVGRAAYPLDLFPPGAYKLGASYGGDVSYNASPAPSPVALTVTQAATKLSAAVSAPSIDVAVTATITVTLDTDSTGAFPSGGITLAANGNKFPGTIRQVRTVINSDQEIAVFQIAGSALVSGVNTFTATYPGDTNYASSTATVTLTVTGVPPTFTLTAPPSGITLATDATSATGVMTLQSKNGFAGDVQLACSFGAPSTPSAPECAVTSPVTLAADGTATATVTISAPLSFASLGGGPANLLPKAGGGLALASLLLLLPGTRRRALGSMAAVLLVLLSLGAIGCGVHANRHTRITGNFTATIMGTSGNLVVNTPVQVQVQ